jgi:hypothetical protein
MATLDNYVTLKAFQGLNLVKKDAEINSIRLIR